MRDLGERGRPVAAGRSGRVLPARDRRVARRSGSSGRCEQTGLRTARGRRWRRRQRSAARAARGARRRARHAAARAVHRQRGDDRQRGAVRRGDPLPDYLGLDVYATGERAWWPMRTRRAVRPRGLLPVRRRAGDAAARPVQARVRSSRSATSSRTTALLLRLSGADPGRHDRRRGGVRAVRRRGRARTAPDHGSR